VGAKRDVSGTYTHTQKRYSRTSDQVGSIERLHCLEDALIVVLSISYDGPDYFVTLMGYRRRMGARIKLKEAS
jgi:hypothetical protein